MLREEEEMELKENKKNLRNTPNRALFQVMVDGFGTATLHVTIAASSLCRQTRK